MNYIKEINAFYDTIEQEPLSASAVALWHTLIHINNKARWAESFIASATNLQYKGGLGNSSFQRGRTQLTERGYITWESRGKNKAARYHLVPLTKEDDNTHVSQEPIAQNNQTVSLPSEQTQGQAQTQTQDQPAPTMNTNQDVNLAQHQADHSTPEPETHAQPDTQPDQNDPKNQKTQTQPSNTIHTSTRNTVHTPVCPTDQQAEDNADYLTDHQTDPLIKQDITKPNETNKQQQPTDAIRFYNENFGTASPFVAESILHWTQDLPEDLIIHAMERTLEQGKTHWGYVKGILKVWTKKGIHTIQAAHADRMAFQNNKHKHHSVKQENIPDWFNTHNQKKAPKQEKTHTKEDEARILKETQAMLDAFQLETSNLIQI